MSGAPASTHKLNSFTRIAHCPGLINHQLPCCGARPSGMAVCLGDGEMALEYGGRTLSRYEVSLSLGAKLESVTNPRLFASPYETGQPKLFALSALGEGGWIKAMRLKGYAPRSPGRPKALFRYAEAL